MNESLIRKLYPLFEKDLVEEILREGEQRHFKPNEVLMRKGQFIRSTLLILSGIIKVYREDDEGNEFLMYYLRPGEACALSLVCAAKHEASPILAKSDTDTEAILIPVDLMSEWMAKYKSWYQLVIET
jgi:CRP/FNR family transcriptional regulator